MILSTRMKFSTGTFFLNHCFRSNLQYSDQVPRFSMIVMSFYEKFQWLHKKINVIFVLFLFEFWYVTLSFSMEEAFKC
jgi:hypothetical protein